MPGMKDGQPFVGKRIEKVTADDGEDVSIAQQHYSAPSYLGA